MKYKIYVFLDQFDRPYYVGKTNNFKRRRKEHVLEIKIGNPLPKYNKARALLKKGHKFRMRTIATAKTEERAFKLERKYIRELRKKYVLYNLTYGGPDEKPLKINFPIKKGGKKSKNIFKKPVSPLKKKVRKKLKKGLTKLKK